MLKKILIFVFALALLIPVNSVKADTYPNIDTDWRVVFDGDKLTSNYNEETIRQALQGMQPGDEADLEFTLVNDYKDAVDWWMGNEALKSFEDDSDKTSGGAYIYTLTYVGPDGNENVIYTSDSVGGEGVDEALEGLHGATDALKDLFYLGSIGAGKTAKVRLHIALDGETQNNSYQDKLAKLQIRFAVEIPTTSVVHFVVPKTDSGLGILDDLVDGKGLNIYFLAAIASFLLMVVLAAYMYLNRKARKSS